MSDNDEYIKFKSADELKKWLVNDKKVDEDILGDAATTLFNRSFLTSSSLMGITADELKAEKLSTSVARELSNKLKERSQQDLVLNVLTKVDERLENMEVELKKIKTDPPQQLQPSDEIVKGLKEQNAVINALRVTIEGSHTTIKSMSQVNSAYAYSLLNGNGIVQVFAFSDESVGLDHRNWEPFTWINSENDDTDRAKDWLEEVLLGQENNQNHGIFNVTGFGLPTVKGNGKQSSGKSDLAIGEKGVMERTIKGTDAHFTFAKGIIELKTEKAELKIGQNLLEIFALSTTSTFGKGVSLLATDCIKKWEVYWFSSATTIERVNYLHGNKACEQFMHLIRTTRERQLKLVEPVRETLVTIPEHVSEQDLGGFDLPAAEKQKAKALDDDVEMERFADHLSYFFAERPVIPSWARASAKCPDYYV